MLRCYCSHSRHSSLFASRCSNLLRCMRRTRHICFSQAASCTMPDSLAQSPRPPAPPAAHNCLAMLSSSPLPDAHDLFVKRPRAPVLRSGSAAEPIPPQASATFMSASALLRSARAMGDDSADPIDEPELPVTKQTKKTTTTTTKRARRPAEKNQQQKTKASKQVAKKPIVLSSDGESPESAQSRVLVAADAGGQTDDATIAKDLEYTPLKPKPWKKYKIPDDPSYVANAEKASETTAASSSTLESKRTNDGEIAGKQMLEVTEILGLAKPKTKRLRASTPEPINLEAAVPRRLDWTPPRQASAVKGTTDAVANTSADDPFPSFESTSPIDTNVFRTLHETYGHKADDEGSSLSRKPQAKVLGKRKLIEMVAINQHSEPTEAGRKPSPVKEKAQKKKPRTITDLAMAPYMAQAAESANESPRGGSLANYFQVEDGGPEPPKPATAGKNMKAAKVTKSRKKALPKKPTLLSPRTAMKQSAAQDFVFGTFSQLAREQSPTLLRDLHEALKASTLTDETGQDSFAGPKHFSEANKRGKGLWSVSARDEDGEMVNVDVIDLVGSPTIYPEDNSILDPWTQLTQQPAALEPKTLGKTLGLSIMEVGNKPVTSSEQTRLPKPKILAAATQQKTTINAAAIVSPFSSTESFPLVNDLSEYEMPPPSNQQQSLEENNQSPTRASTNSPQKPRPKYESFTDARLAKEVSKFGFKAVKTRTAMISLLDQCWRSKNQLLGQTAAFSTSPAYNSPAKRKEAVSKTAAVASAQPAKKSRGRAKKVAAVTDGADGDENANSPRASAGGKAEAPTTPKKRGRPRNAPEKSPPSLQTSPKTKPRSKLRASSPQRKKAAQPVLEIKDSDLDSDSDLSLSQQQLFSPPNHDVSLVGDDTELSVNISALDEQSALFGSITKAVTSAPRTTDPLKPSWHEKMLMYDPIVLEDLAAWLNAGQLTRVGHDEEVSPLKVKKWCESRSICCVWKATYRGKERQRV